MTFILWFSLFSYYIILCSSDFLVTGINNVFLPVVDWIFSLILFVGSFEVCYSFVDFVYVYCLVHKSLVVFCLCSVKMLFSFLYLLILAMFISVSCSVLGVSFSLFVFVNFSNIYICFAFPSKKWCPVLFLFVGFSYVLRCKCFHVSVTF